MPRGHGESTDACPARAPLTTALAVRPAAATPPQTLGSRRPANQAALLPRRRACRLSGSCKWMMSLRVKGSSVSRSFQNLGLMFSSAIACRGRRARAARQPPPPGAAPQRAAARPQRGATVDSAPAEMRKQRCATGAPATARSAAAAVGSARACQQTPNGAWPAHLASPPGLAR